MARVNGPLMSMDASGSLGGTIVFSKWKGRPYVRQLVRPANPRSGGQVSMRASLKFLAPEWTQNNSAFKASWEALADSLVVSPFNAYMKENLKRNADFLAPSRDAEFPGVDTPSAIDVFTATAGVRSITIAINDAADFDTNWGFFIFRSTTTGFTPGFTNLVAMLKANSSSPVSWVDHNLTPDTYYYDAKPFTQDSSIGTLKGEINAEVV